MAKLQYRSISKRTVEALSVEKDTPTTANEAIGVLSRMLNQAEAWGLAPPGGNPCRFVVKYKTWTGAGRDGERRPGAVACGRGAASIDADGVPMQRDRHPTLRGRASGGERAPAPRQQDGAAGGAAVAGGGGGSRRPAPRRGQSLGHRRPQPGYAPAAHHPITGIACGSARGLRMSGSMTSVTASRRARLARVCP